VGDPNPEYLSAPGGRNYRGVVVVRGRGNGRDALPVIIVNVNRSRAALFSNGRTAAATVDYGGNVMVVQGRAGSPNRYIAGVYNFAAVSQGRATPSMGEQLDSFPLLYQVGATPYWFGGRQVFAGMPFKPIVEAEQLLVADRVVNVCYAVAPNRLRCLGLDKTLAPINSRPIAFPSGIRDATTVGDLHVATTIGEHLYFFLLGDGGTIQTVRLPAFEIPENLAKTDRAAMVAKATADAAAADTPESTGPTARTWRDASGRFQVEAELVGLKDGQVTLKKADGSTVTVPIERLCRADRDYLERHGAADAGEFKAPRPRPEIALFNGNDLTGWEFMPIAYSKSKSNKTWVADAQRNVLMSLGGDDHNNLATTDAYGDFRLSLEWRFRPGGDVGPNGSGVVVRADGLDSKGQNPKGIEIDLRPNKDVAAGIGTGCLIAYSTAARNHLGATDGELQKRQLGWLREPPLIGAGEWNECVITCQGEHLAVEMNGVEVNRASGLRIPKGRIVLRNQKTAVEFRNIRLVELAPAE